LVADQKTINHGMFGRIGNLPTGNRTSDAFDLSGLKPLFGVSYFIKDNAASIFLVASRIFRFAFL
jgi:hypothetical protein